MTGRYYVFPQSAPGSQSAFDQAIAATDQLELAKLTSFFAAQWYRREVWILDTHTNAWMARYTPVGDAAA